jgi:hypothetical protein
MSGLVVNGDLRVNGSITAEYVGLPANTLRNAGVAADAEIETSKMAHRHVEHYSQPTGTAVVAGNAAMALITVGAGTLKQFSAAITGAVATDVSRTVTVDLKKSTGGGAFASVLSAALVFNSVSALLEFASATLSSVALVEGDVLQVTVAVAGGSGSQAQGLVVKLIYDEASA